MESSVVEMWEPTRVRTVTLTCIVLHNICIEREDTLSNQLDLTIDPETNERTPREVIREILNMRNCQKVADNSRQAARIWDALTQMLWQEKRGLVVWNYILILPEQFVIIIIIW